MKQIRILFKTSIAVALLALMVSCASTQTSVENKESMLVAAGFKVITPKTPAHQQKLQQLPPGKIAMIQKSGKTFYVYPDAATTRLTSVARRSIRLTNRRASLTISRRRISKALRCTRTQT